MAYATSSGNYFTINRNYNGVTEFSVSLWIYYSTDASGTMAGCWKDSGNVHQWLVSKSASNILTCAIHDGSYRIATGGSISKNAWQHIGLVYSVSAATLRTYINGTFSTSVAVNASGSMTNRGTDASGIGARHDGTDPFAGNVAEFATWKAALTDAEMASLGGAFVPSNVRKPDVYIPLVRNKLDLTGNCIITTVGSPTVENHPRIYV